MTRQQAIEKVHTILSPLWGNYIFRTVEKGINVYKGTTENVSCFIYIVESAGHPGTFYLQLRIPNGKFLTDPIYFGENNMSEIELLEIHR